MKALIFFLAFTFSSCATAPQKEKPLSLLSEETFIPLGLFPVSRYHFKNGLRLLVVEDHSSPTFAYHVLYQVGSRDELPGKTGLAHFFEHMMFHQTTHLKPGEADQILDQAGAEGRNAFTSHDFTFYVQELPSSQLDLITRIEADRMENLLFDQKAFDTEREIIKNERHSTYESDPSGTLLEELFALAFQTHPYRWPTIGYPRDLQKMSIEDALQFYQTYYAPNRAVVIVSGDVKPAEVASITEKYYSSIAPRVDIIPPVDPEPLPSRPRSKKIHLNLQAEKLFVAYPIPDLTDPDLPALTVLQSILLNGRSSRIYRALVNTGIASNVDTVEMGERDPSLMIATIDLHRGKTAQSALQILHRELKKIQTERVPKSELQKAKNQLQFDFFHSFGSNSKKAWFLGQYEVNTGDFRNGFKYHKAEQEVTAEDVQEVANKYLNPKHELTLRGIPK